VTKDPRYAQKALSCTVIPPGESYKITGTLLRCFTARVRGGDACELEPVNVPKKGKWHGKKHLIIITYSQTPASAWYNGCSYLDTMDYKSVQRFIEVTHEAYRKACGEEFGKTIPGMFTDEANRYHINLFPGRNPLSYPAPWTPKLPTVFKKRYGYDILDYLPHIFFDIDGRRVSTARYHYHDCTTFLFVDAFGRQSGEWCERNGIALTGHVLHEETPSSQTKVIGDAMRFYEHMHLPGIDILTAHWYEYDTAKQCTSMARQMGRKWVLSEMYAGTGWDFTFEGHKAVGDWQAALGVNLRCNHLSWFTMAGEAKRDCPASILHQSPWWRQYKKVEDYFARVNVLMTVGEAVCDVLVIHPIESTWVRCRAGWLDGDPEVEQLDKNLADIRDWLMQAQLEFDYGNEEIMSRYASVGRKGGKPALKVGKVSYATVVVPPMLTVRRSTVVLLV
ncbi:MAG: glycosyl hydrolase, partial [Planctomycetia bacterium]|nr:glycosyl hydrolase [Planctomycetia bacterium]